MSGELSSVDRQILQMRMKGNASLITLCKFLENTYPYDFSKGSSVDMLIGLKHICNLLDEHKLPYSRREGHTAFNNYWDNQSEDKNAYMAWVLNGAVDKVLFPSKKRGSEKTIPQNIPQKMPLVRICEGSSLVDLQSELKNHILAHPDDSRADLSVEPLEEKTPLERKERERLEALKHD